MIEWEEVRSSGANQGESSARSVDEVFLAEVCASLSVGVRETERLGIRARYLFGIHLSSLGRKGAKVKTTNMFGRRGPAVATVKPRRQRRLALIARRKAIGWTQENFAAALGVQTNTVYRWESGRTTPAPWRRDLIAEKLQITVLELANLLGEHDWVEASRVSSVLEMGCRRSHANATPRAAREPITADNVMDRIHAAAAIVG